MKPDETDDLLLAAYLDGELSPGETLAMERRLEADPALRRRLEELEALSGAVRRVLAEAPVPEGLGARLGESFGKVEVLPRRTAATTRWRSLAAGLVLGLLGGGIGGYGLGAWGGGDGAEALDAIYAGHLRGLAAPQPFDVASSDRHVVKPWFNGRTTVAPDAPDLSADGFPLVGGRVDVVDGEKVPTLVYRRRQHVISVTVLPKLEDAAALSLRREGSNIERWDAGDLSYVAVSDLNAAELAEFAGLFRAKVQPRA